MLDLIFQWYTIRSALESNSRTDSTSTQSKHQSIRQDQRNGNVCFSINGNVSDPKGLPHDSQTNARVSIDPWAELDAADILLKHFRASYYKCAKEFVRKLDDAKIWRGGEQRGRGDKKADSDAGIPKKRKRSNASSTTTCPPPVPKWTKEQREEAAEKKK